MNITSLKGMVAKVLTAGVLAGAVALAMPAKASAQEVIFAGPYQHFGYQHRVYFDRYRAEEFRRHEEWLRFHEHRRFERDRFFYR